MTYTAYTCLIINNTKSIQKGWTLVAEPRCFTLQLLITEITVVLLLLLCYYYYCYHSDANLGSAVAKGNRYTAPTTWSIL